MKRRMRWYRRQGWTYVDRLDQMEHSYHDMISWCRRNLDGNDWASRLKGGSGEPEGMAFVFRRQEDAALFILKWS